MRLTILAVGRLRGGPEAEMVDDYLARFERAGRPIGLGPARVIEIEDRRGGGPAAEAELMLAALPKAAGLAALDERGTLLASPEFAALLRRRADAGLRELVIAIGGADGLGAAVQAKAEPLISFGPMVWPHMLVRVMLAEQLYRAATILAGGPYHRCG